MGKKFCLTLDKNVLDFCKLNDIEDVRGFAIKCFEKGLTIEKYGETPLLMPKEIQTVIKEVEKEVIKEVEIPVEVVKEVKVEVPVEKIVEKIVEKPIEVIKEVIKEVKVEVPVEKIVKIKDNSEIEKLTKHNKELIESLAKYDEMFSKFEQKISVKKSKRDNLYDE